ncbi:MAG: hypothetical protein WDM78_16600 [Puia sp.]
MLIHIPGSEVSKNFESLRLLLAKNPHVTSVSLSVAGLTGQMATFRFIQKKVTSVGEPMNIMSVSFDFFKTAGIPVIRGREFTRDRANDTLLGVILNETAVSRLGFTNETVLGKRSRSVKF